MHKARDSKGRFIAKAKSSIFTTPSSSRHRQESPPSTLSLKIFGIQGAAELEDSPIPPTKSHLENKETLSHHPPLIEELEDFKDSKETIMAEEVIDGGRGRGRRGGNSYNNEKYLTICPP